MSSCNYSCSGSCEGTCQDNCPGYVQSSAENTLDYFNLTTDEKSSLDKHVTNFEVAPINNLLDLDSNDIMSSCNASCFGTCEGYCPSTCTGTCKGTDGW